MARLIGSLLGGVLLASTMVAVGAAEPEMCMATEDVMRCPDPNIDDTAVNSQPADVSMSVTQPTPVVQPMPAAVTRTLDAPTVVQPFAGLAVSAVEPGEQAPKVVQPPDHQKLPPGPPSRFP